MIGGSYYAGAVNGNDFALVRYNTDGTLDPTFDGDGIATTDIGGIDNYIYSLALQSNGMIVAAGYSQDSSDYFVVARYATDGILDTTFGTNGATTTSIGTFPGHDDEGFAVAIQSNGRIVVAGYSNASGNYDFALARYNTNGELDMSFGEDGIVLTDIGGDEDGAYALAIQTDGKIVAGGWSNNGGINEFAIARYWP